MYAVYFIWVMLFSIKFKSRDIIFPVKGYSHFPFIHSFLILLLLASKHR